jgi:hypothetical protein
MVIEFRPRNQRFINVNLHDATTLAREPRCEPQQLQYRPDASRWSVAENLEHITIVEQNILAGVARTLQMAAGARKEICCDRRTAAGKFWPRGPATHRARTPAPHFALAGRQSSKRIRRHPPAHHRIRHHRGRYQGVAPLFHAASLLRRTRLLPMVHPRRRPLRAPLQSMRRHKGVRRLSPLAPFLSGWFV